MKKYQVELTGKIECFKSYPYAAFKHKETVINDNTYKGKSFYCVADDGQLKEYNEACFEPLVKDLIEDKTLTREDFHDFDCYKVSTELDYIAATIIFLATEQSDDVNGSLKLKVEEQEYSYSFTNTKELIAAYRAIKAKLPQAPQPSLMTNLYNMAKDNQNSFTLGFAAGSILTAVAFTAKANRVRNLQV